MRTIYWPLKQQHFSDYLQLIRFDRPIGTLLLLYPALTALIVAAGGLPSFKNLIIFSLGTFLMRSAGCAINDFADRHWDGAVSRTKNRPLAQKRIAPQEAVAIAVLLTLIAFFLVLMTNTNTVLLSFAAAGLAALYPFTKRVTHLPQLFLGAAFAWSIPMAFTAEESPLSMTTWLLFSATLLWTVAYDTLYAMVDRNDDLKVGIKSTAILFGRHDRSLVALIQTNVILFLLGIGIINNYSFWFYIANAGIVGLFAYQHYLIKDRDPALCFKAFLHNQWVGVLLVLGTLLGQFNLSF